MWFDYLIILSTYLILIIIVTRIYCSLTMGWNKSNVCLVGKTAIITGARSGLGFQTALILASRGARVIMADRGDSSKARKIVMEETKSSNVISKFVDLADLNTVREFAEEINAGEKRLDILINNAGVACVHGFTKDGLQQQMQINHLGPFLLTHMLIDKLKKSAPSRIIFVSSSAAFTSFLSVDSLIAEPNSKTVLFPYGRTKLCNAISTVGFADKLKGSGVTCNALHPGIVATPMVETFMSVQNSTVGKKIWYGAVKIFGKTPYEGAQTQAYLAMADEVKNVTGQFFMDCAIWFRPLKIRNKKLCEEIWRKSEELVNLDHRYKL